MFLLQVGFWDVVGDCVQIFLCFLILIYFIRNRKRQRQQLSRRTINTEEKSFNEQVRTRTVQQQIELSFVNIWESLTAERENLMCLLGDNHNNSADVGVSRMRSISPAPDNPANLRITDENAEGYRHPGKIRKFSLEGMSARNISDKLKIPLSEVELILSLQKE